MVLGRINNRFDSIESTSDCVRSRLHRLITCLIQLSKKPTCKSAKSISTQMIATCLAELGASDLTTLILRDQSVQMPDESTPHGAMTVISRGYVIQELGLSIFPLLVRYLFSGSVHLLEQSAQVRHYSHQIKHCSHPVSIQINSNQFQFTYTDRHFN